MKTIKVRIARIYMMESSKHKDIVHYLKEVANIRGVSVFRAISGYGNTEAHNASLIDISFHLPLAVEFFDDEDKVMLALEHLSNEIKPEHIVFWDAYSNI
jgi:PII-like signaling protein